MKEGANLPYAYLAVELSKGDAIGLYTAAVAVLSLFVFLVFGPPWRKTKITILVVTCILTIILLWHLFFSRVEVMPQAGRFDRGVGYYNEGKIKEAIEEFEGFIENPDSQDPKILVRAHYYLASANLRLPTPDCASAVKHIPQIAPDPDGLEALLVNECKKIGCIDCSSLLLFN